MAAPVPADDFGLIVALPQMDVAFLLIRLGCEFGIRDTPERVRNACQFGGRLNRAEHG
ncbi:hypothetical protein ACFY1C_34010 [Streptomyces sp. NPDC001279]|uniref:hypothetical protein n=1 Tax=Streptomyces sp. NPDC001279 TaxID=3364556 RepID=UPI003681C807